MPVVRVESIAAGGDGIGRLDGLVVFVPRTAPGELVEAAVRPQGRLARGRLLRILEPSADRVAPACRHYDGDRCGGCQVQHVSPEAQLEAKRRIVRDAFERIGKRNVDVPSVVRSPANWHYRSRLTLAMRWRNGAWVMGLHTFDDVDRVFDLRECPITDEKVVDAWLAIRAQSQLLPRAPELRGTVRRIGDENAFILEGGARWTHASEFAARLPDMHLIRWKPDAGAVRRIVDRRTGTIPEESFDQVNQPVAAAARDEIIRRALSVKPASAVDAYAGLGFTSRALSDADVTVTSIELDPDATAFASNRVKPPSRVLTGRVEDLLPGALPADVVILNPPRAGVDRSVTDALSANPPRRVLYMSCNPTTLARDVARLPRFRVNSVLAYDMFPQTAHVEVVCELEPEEP